MTYTARHVLFAALLGLLLGALAVNAVRAASRSSAAVIPASEFRPVGTNPHGEPEPQRTTEAPSTILDPFPVSPPPERAAVEVPEPVLVVRSMTPPMTAVHSGRIDGLASWYEWRTGEAAAGPALRDALGLHWRGSVVTVCAASCTVVRLSDWCGCPGGRVIDLDSRSFAALAPLSAGLVTVTVSW